MGDGNGATLRNFRRPQSTRLAGLQMTAAVAGQDGIFGVRAFSM
jgi:hypothetical protein